MPNSQNGWPVVTGGLTSLPHVTGKALTGPVWVVLYWLCQQYAAHVEPIKKSWSWGYSHRKISGSSKWSNHASGTAIDLNAPRHPQGKPGTFTKPQRAAIDLIVKAAGGVLRWGGTYKDEMHFEIAPSVNPAKVQHLANTVLQVALSDAGHNPGPVDGIRGPKTTAALRAFQLAHHITETSDGPATWAALSPITPKEDAA